jgi:hypothetical protein
MFGGSAQSAFPRCSIVLANMANFAVEKPINNYNLG